MLGTLPVHPLLVHFAVVMVLATALLQLAALAAGRVRRWLGWVMPALGLATAVVARVTHSLGEVLLESRFSATATVPPVVDTHAALGTYTSYAAMAMGVLTVAYWLATADHRWVEKVRFVRGVATRLAISVVTGMACVAAIVLDVLAGHSGSVAVWG